MMHKQAKIEIELFVLLIIVVATSAAILLLIQTGVVSVRADTENVQILNAEFLPLGREGSLTLREFSFCGYVSEDYQCIGAKKEFRRGEEVHFLLLLESTPFEGEVKLQENYRIRNPSGALVLEAEQGNTIYFDGASRENTEQVAFKDFFTLGEDLPLGEYTLELVLTNPLLDKKVVQVEKFMVLEKMEEEAVEGEGY